MSLKQIPQETCTENCNVGKDGAGRATAHKKNRHAHQHFNPGNKMSVPQNTKRDEVPLLKDICLKLVHFINRGERFTANQIDEVIMGMHRGILRLQKKKQAVMHKSFARDKKAKRK